MTSLDVQVTRVLNEMFAARTYRQLDEFLARDRSPKPVR
jgi:hypothetical protein